MTRSTLVTTQMIQKVLDTLLVFSHSRTAIYTPGTTQTFGARLTLEAVSSIANSPSAELYTPSVNKVATLPSPLELVITDLAQDVANELLHVEFTNLFIKFPTFLILSLINLSASNDVNMHFQAHIEEKYSSVP